MNMIVRTGIQIRWEPWETVRPDIALLWELHNAEIAAPGDKALLDPNWNWYDAVAAADKDHWITIRDDGRLVGYVFALVDYHKHRSHTLSAFWDLYWVHPDYRKGLLGYKLLRAAKDSLWKRGVRKQYAGTKLWKDVGVIFERQGWRETERLYTISMDE